MRERRELGTALAPPRKTNGRHEMGVETGVEAGTIARSTRDKFHSPSPEGTRSARTHGRDARRSHALRPQHARVALDEPPVASTSPAASRR